MTDLVQSLNNSIQINKNKKVRQDGNYKIPFFLLVIINLLILFVLMVLFYTGQVKLWGKYLELRKFPDSFSYLFRYGITNSKNQAEKPPSESLEILLDGTAKDREENLLLDVKRYSVIGSNIIINSVYENILDTSSQERMFVTYSMNKDLYKSLENPRWYINRSQPLTDSPKNMDISLHNLNIYKLDSETDKGYSLVASQSGYFKSAKFYNNGKKLLTVQRDYDNYFYIYIYDTATNSFKKISEMKTGSNMDYYAIGEFSENEEFALMEVGYEIIVPVYVIDLTTGSVNEIQMGNYKDVPLSYGRFEWLDNGNLQYKETICYPCITSDNFDYGAGDLEWIVEYNPAQNKIVSRKLMSDKK